MLESNAMQPALQRRRRRSVLDLTPGEVPWHWQALAALFFVFMIASVIEESAVCHRGMTPSANRVDINYATPDELDSLPGIGPALARAIIAARPFASAGDLARVRGIGAKQAGKLLPLIQVSHGRRSVDQR